MGKPLAKLLASAALAAALLAPAATEGCGGEGPREWTVLSPDGTLSMRVNLVGTADATGGGVDRLTYTLLRGDQVLVADSPLGIETTDQSFTDGLSFREETTQTIDDRYQMLVGKRLERHAVANQQTLRFTNTTGAQMELIVRMQDDGAAFRYRLLGDGEVTVTGESTGFQMSLGAEAFMAPSDISGFLLFGVYELLYEHVQVGQVANASGWGFPALFEGPDDNGWVLITEAGLDESYCATRLDAAAPGGLYSIRFPAMREGQLIGDVNPTSTLPLTTPWRVMIAGGLDTVVESTLVDDLSPPSVIEDTSWIRPGRAAWSWLTQDTGDEALQREYLASAVEYGWEHVLIDAHWNEFEAAIPQLVQDARASGVSVHLWYNSGGEHNLSAEPPRDRMLDRDVRRAEMAQLEQWGVAGIKIDFFESDKQDRIQQYLAILEDAADHHLLINFHGATLPRGWQRTYPNLMTYEAVRGGEAHRFPIESPTNDAHLNYVFARNVVGSMDYTPVVFQEALDDVGLSYISSLAQAVLFESGITHFGGRADSVETEGYRAVFAAAPYVRTFMMDVPAVWDETRLLTGDPRSHVVLARRSGQTWYLAALTGTTDTREEVVPLDFLGDGDFEMEVITRGATDDSFAQSVTTVSRDDELRLSLQPSDGAVVVLRP